MNVFRGLNRPALRKLFAGLVVSALSFNSAAFLLAQDAKEPEPRTKQPSAQEENKAEEQALLTIGSKAPALNVEHWYKTVTANLSQ